MSPTPRKRQGRHGRPLTRPMRTPDRDRGFYAWLQRFGELTLLRDQIDDEIKMLMHRGWSDEI
jgi:hypothetical protein